MVKRTDRPAMTIAVDMGRKAAKTNKQTIDHLLIASVSRDKTHPCTCRICKQRRLKMGMCTRTVCPCADPEGGGVGGPDPPPGKSCYMGFYRN